MILAGFPPIITFDGYSFPKTTEPAAIIELSPIFAPFKIITLLPIQTLFPIMTSFLFPCLCLLYGESSDVLKIT